jgi:hypothetical protein
MGKRVSQDATQELSASQLVPDKRPPAKPPQYGTTPKNDASMWMQSPVSADDFMGVPKKKPIAPGGGGRAVLVAVLVAAFVAVCGAGVWFAFLREPPKSSSALDTAKSQPPAPAPAVTSSVADAAVAVAARDAAGAAADAGATTQASAMQVDAISSADQALKKSKKRPATKKTGTKKKTATGTKKRK